MTNSRSIRIFLSSTFRDLQKERSHLVKKIIPSLKEYGKKHNVDVSVVDLRWGVTESESRTGKVLEICFDEISRTRPYFIGIIGGRYGWMPQVKDIPNIEHLGAKFPWFKECLEQGMSITEMEMQYGAMQSEVPVDASFFIGDGKPSMRDAEGSENRRKLERLKEKVRDAAKDGKCTVDDFDSVETLGSLFFERVKNIIDIHFPDTTDDSDLRTLQQQESYLQSLREVYSADAAWLNIDEDEVEGDKRIVAVVYGEPGSGKTAYLANLFPGGVLIYERYIVDEDAETEQDEAIEIVTVPIIHTVVGELSTSLDDIKRLFDKSIEVRRLDSSKPILWIVDGVERLSDNEINMQLGFFNRLADNIKVIVATSDKMMADFYRRLGGLRQFEAIESLRDNQVMWLVEAYLKQASKTLDGRQHLHILGNPMLRNPALLKLFIAELIQVGEFEHINEWIDYYLDAKTPVELMERIYRRMENDFGEEQVRAVLQIMAFSPIGLPDEENILPKGVGKLEFTAIVGALESVVSHSNNTIHFVQPVALEAALQRYVKENKTQKQVVSRCIRILKKAAYKYKRNAYYRGFYMQGLTRLIFRYKSSFRMMLFYKLHPLSSLLALPELDIVALLTGNKWFNPLLTPLLFLLNRREIQQLRGRKTTDIEVLSSQCFELLYETDSDKLEAVVAGKKTSFENKDISYAAIESVEKHIEYLQLVIALQRLGRWEESERFLSAVDDFVAWINNLLFVFALLDQTLHERGDISVCIEAFNKSKSAISQLVDNKKQEDLAVWFDIFNILVLLAYRADEGYKKAIELCHNPKCNVHHLYTISKMVSVRKELLLENSLTEKQYNLFFAEFYCLMSEYENDESAYSSLNLASYYFKSCHMYDKAIDCCAKMVKIARSNEGQEWRKKEYDGLVGRYNCISSSSCFGAEDKLSMLEQIIEQNPIAGKPEEQSVLNQKAGFEAREIFLNTGDIKYRDKSLTYLRLSNEMAGVGQEGGLFYNINTMTDTLFRSFLQSSKGFTDSHFIPWILQQYDTVPSNLVNRTFFECKSQLLTMQGRYEEAMDILSSSVNIPGDKADLVHQALYVVEFWNTPENDTRSFPVLPEGAVPMLYRLCQLRNGIAFTWGRLRLGKLLAERLEYKLNSGNAVWTDAKILSQLYKGRGDIEKGRDLLLFCCDDSLQNEWRETEEVIRFALEYDGKPTGWDSIAGFVVERLNAIYDNIRIPQSLGYIARLYAISKEDFETQKNSAIALNQWSSQIGQNVYFWSMQLSCLVDSAEKLYNGGGQEQNQEFDRLKQRAKWFVDIILDNKFDITSTIQIENDDKPLALREILLNTADFLADHTDNDSNRYSLYQFVYKPLGCKEAKSLPESMVDWFDKNISDDYILPDDQCEAWLNEYNDPEVTADMVRIYYRIVSAYENENYAKVVELWPLLDDAIKSHEVHIYHSYAESLARKMRYEEAAVQLGIYLSNFDYDEESAALLSFLQLKTRHSDDAHKTYDTLCERNELPEGITTFDQWSDYVYGKYCQP